MKILFSPAESKKSGGFAKEISKDSFLFPELFEYRKEVLDRYNSFVQNASDEELSKLFGIKDSKKFEVYKKDIFSMPIMKPIERYDGVAYDYLDYGSLDEGSQSYIDNNVIIFSNLFGAILAGDMGVPEYKLKQGEKIGDFATEVFYKEHFSKSLDEMLSDKVYLDLRAGFYNKFYKSTSPHITLKFLKDGKVVSHWAKAYRGIVLKYMAINHIKDEKEFFDMQIPGLILHEIKETKLKKEIIFKIE